MMPILQDGHHWRTRNLRFSVYRESIFGGWVFWCGRRKVLLIEPPCGRCRLEPWALPSFFQSGTLMTYSIIGSGNIGQALAKLFANSGQAVRIANTRGPESIAPLVKDLGDKVIPQSLQDALKSDLIILAVPFRAHPAVAAALSDWSGKVIVDAMNTYGISPAELKGQVSTELVATAFRGAKVVKTFNQLPAKLLAQDPSTAGGRRVMFLSSDDEVAQTSVGKLVSDLGFAPIPLGKITQGGKLITIDGPLILQNLIKQA
jgi:predicted dinucleotide-binding enzyme